VKAYRSFAVTVQGGSHIKSGLVCQDASSSYDGENVAIAVVADGHGDSNCFRSDKGAEFAVKCAEEGIGQFVKELDELAKGKHKNPSPALREFRDLIREKSERHEKLRREREKHRESSAEDLTAFEEIDRLIHRELGELIRENLIKQMVSSWKNRVVEHYNSNPFTEKELENVSEKYRKEFEQGNEVNKAYGTSLIAAAITPWYWFGCHIGDGRFTVLYKDGSGGQPVPWDSRCYLNVTTSICDDDILERGEEGVRTCLFLHTQKAPPVAFFLCSDGVDDNYPVDGNEEYLYRLYRTIGVTFAEEDFEPTIRQIKDLADGYATKGKGDDTSLAGIVNIEKLKEVAGEWKRKREADDAEKERAKAEAAAKAKEEEEKRKKADEEAAARRKKREEERAEAERVKAEAEAEEKNKAEAEKNKAETERLKAEAERTKAEIERLKAEAERLKAEAEKKAADESEALKTREQTVQKGLSAIDEAAKKIDVLA
jgi:serine/threonine protein phosphatase PrpC